MREERFYSLEIATHIGRISRGQATRWARSGSFVPSVLYWTESRPYTYLYSFADLVALRVISILRVEYGISLTDAFGVASFLRNIAEAPWSEVRLHIPVREISGLSQGNGGDRWLEVGPIAEDVHEEADKLWNRSPDDYGKVERKRSVMHGALVVKGTRIPVATVVALVDAGWDIDRIRQGYPTLQPEDIQGVMRYVEEQKQVA